MTMTTLDCEKRKTKRVYVCELCSKTFTNHSNFKYHLAHHSNESPWLCHYCPRTWKTKADLLQHQRVVHLQTHDCKLCGLSFPTRSEYILHHRTHQPQIKEPTKMASKKCDICEKMFTNLRSHIQSVHENVRQHVCNVGVCTKAFFKKSGLDRHIITVHDKTKHWACDLCGKRFGEKTLLTRHRKIHEKAALVQCNTENAEDEEIVDKNKTLMRCGMCRKILNSRSALKRHKLFVHEKKQDLLCDFCPKLFGERSDLLRHIRRMHAKENGSTVTEVRGIKTENDIADTSDKNETYACSSCDRILTTKWGFEAHQETCRLKKQQQFNNQEVKEVKKEQHQSDKISEEIEEDEDLIDGKDKGMNVDKNRKIENDVQNRMEHIFLATDEDNDEMKKEPISFNEFVSNDSSVQTDTRVCKEDSRSHSPCAKLKVEVKEEVEPEDEDLTSCEYAADFEDKENDFDELFANDSSDEDYKPVDDSKVDLNDCVIDSKFAVKKEFDCRVVLKKMKFPSPINAAEEISDAKNDEESRTCHKCEPKKIFKNLRSFQRHGKTVHLEQRFQCDICNKKFSVKRSLERHIRGTHQRIFNFKCEEIGCEKSFHDVSGLRNHQNSDHNKGNESDRTCKICFKVFKYQKYLKTHILSIHKEPQFPCPTCNQSFSFLRSMIRHIQTVHESRKDLTCTNDGCNIVFQSSYELNEHLKIIHGVSVETMPSDEWKNIENSRRCEFCQTIFSSEKALNIHRKTVHEGTLSTEQTAEKIKCDICEKVYVSRSSLYTHKKLIHEGVRWSNKLQCRLCKEIFRSWHQKNKHWKQVHQYGKTIFRKCQLCNKDFQLFEEFKSHIESHVGYFMCIICGAYFTDETSLSVHVESHKSVEGEIKPYECDICSKRFLNKQSLGVHMRKHNPGDHYVCEICGKSYNFFAPFLYHKKGHANQLDFACRYCGKQFIIKRDRMLHERLHTGERPYKCTQCPKSFAVKVGLNKHLKSHDMKFNQQTLKENLLAEVPITPESVIEIQPIKVEQNI